MLADRWRLSRDVRKIRQRRQKGQPVNQMEERLIGRFLQSKQQYAQRQQNMPDITYPQALPVSARHEDIQKLIKENPVVILCGETGSGKTTQLPKICLQLGYGIRGMIGHTQPRRIAARSVCHRIAEELACEVGQQVGYKVRFDEQCSDQTLIKLMTDGMLLTETQHDRYLNQYEVIIIDEAHERSLNIDFLIGYLKHIQPQRPDLKVIITSATIDPERFSRHFDDAPIIEVSGRTYPVDIQYRPLSGVEGQEEDRDTTSAVVDTVLEIDRRDRGDILVFLSGEREIRETADALGKAGLRLTEILPLFGRLSNAEQNRIFRPGSKRHIVLATNIAETSLTVPRIKYVIDAGKARISRYSHRLKIQQLPIERVSQASANQRAGRCGRVSAGVCYRLYADEDYRQRPAFTEPEILRTNLAAVILQMHALQLGHVEAFPFIQPPDARYVRDGMRQLRELGAMDDRDELTPLGKQLSKLPIDPRVGRMLLAANDQACLREMLVIASALETQDPRERPLDRQQQADQAHAQYKDGESDFSSLLNLWQFVEDQREALSGNRFRKLCRQQFLSWLRLREWRDTHHQLSRIVKEMGFKANTRPASYDALHQALLSGLLGHIGYKDEDKIYQGVRQTSFRIFPGSGLGRKTPAWVVAAEIVETSRVFARTVARVEPGWIEEAGQHLLRRQHTEPQWSSKRGYVTAKESVSLYGLTLISNRRVNFGSINPFASRQVFIEQALVGRDFITKATFWKHNIDLLEDIEGLEHRQRRRDVLVDDDVIFAFYDERIPADIHNQRSFEKWLKDTERTEPTRLFMTRELLMQHDAIGVSHERFPDHLQLHGNELPLHYHFSPGQEVDGVTVDIPGILLSGLSDEDFEWLVPGLLDEKITCLIKTLPKRIRKHYVPAPDYARACLEKINIGEGSLLQQLTEALQQMSGYALQLSDWQPGQLPQHLRFNFNVLDTKGKRVASGRELAQLQRGEGRIEAVAATEHAYEKTGIRRWDFGELASSVYVKQGKQQLRLYPAIWDYGDSVSLSLCNSPEQAQVQTRWGVLRLAWLTLAYQRRELEKRFKILLDEGLSYSLFPVNDYLSPDIDVSLCDDLIAQSVYHCFERCMPTDMAVPRTPAQFDTWCDVIRADLIPTGEKVLKVLREIFSQWKAFRDYFLQLPDGSEIRDSIDTQLYGLLYQGFMTGVHDDWLDEYPRFIKALTIRCERYLADPGRDARIHARIAPYATAFEQTRMQWLDEGYDMAELDEAKWALESLRVSLFAQELGTRERVSEKRLRILLAAIPE